MTISLWGASHLGIEVRTHTHGDPTLIDKNITKFTSVTCCDFQRNFSVIFVLEVDSVSMLNNRIYDTFQSHVTKHMLFVKSIVLITNLGLT